MPLLHLPQALYDLFVHNFTYNFSGIVGGYKLRYMCYIANDHHEIPYRDLLEIVLKPQSLFSHRVIFMTPALKSHDALAMSLQVPYHYLKSLQSFLGPNYYLKQGSYRQDCLFCLFLLLYVPCQQLWSLWDSQFT